MSNLELDMSNPFTSISADRSKSENYTDLKIRITDLERALRLANSEAEALRDEVLGFLVLGYYICFTRQILADCILMNKFRSVDFALLMRCEKRS